MRVVFVDMDGVLCDFVGSACRALGVERPDPWPAGVYDMVEVLGLKSMSEMWRACRPQHEFFAHLDWMPDGKAIWATVRELVDPARIFILSMPSHEPGSWSGKVQWVRRHLGGGQVARMVLCENKRLLSSAGSLLIDDRAETVEKWGWEGAGEAVLVPRVHNTGTGNPVEVVRAALLAWRKHERVTSGLAGVRA